jgi:hypothetical protein
MLVNPVLIKRQIAPAHRIAAVRQFVCSTMFMYFPIPADVYRSVKQIDRPDPSKYTLYNMAVHIENTRSIYPEGGANDIVDVLNMLQTKNETLYKEVLKAVSDYKLKQHSNIPDDQPVSS